MSSILNIGTNPTMNPAICEQDNKRAIISIPIQFYFGSATYVDEYQKKKKKEKITAAVVDGANTALRLIFLESIVNCFLIWHVMGTCKRL